MRKLCVALVFVLALTGCGGSSGGSDASTPTTTPSGTPATSGGEVTSTTGLPDNFAFPPAAELEPVTPHITQY
ncbi:MAG: hypothetical protein JWR83_2333, partial [Aeromicrobium sp.]|nr:hypothetical protein [Aeromicrobium sp.]